MEFYCLLVPKQDQFSYIPPLNGKGWEKGKKLMQHILFFSNCNLKYKLRSFRRKSNLWVWTQLKGPYTKLDAHFKEVK